MTTCTEAKRRKRWAKVTDRKLRRSSVRGVDYHDGPLEPASAVEIAEHRQATAVPQVHASALERYVEHRILPWARSTCLREPCLRNRQPLHPDSAITPLTNLDHATACDWLVLWVEVQPVIEDEIERIRAEDAHELQQTHVTPEASPLAVCIDAMYMHDRQTYLNRIKALIGRDANEATADLDNGQLFDLWHWIKSETCERDSRVSGEEVTAKIAELLNEPERL